MLDMLWGMWLMGWFIQCLLDVVSTVHDRLCLIFCLILFGISEMTIFRLFQLLFEKAVKMGVCLAVIITTDILKIRISPS